MSRPKVLIQVYGGVADWTQTKGVDVELIDYDDVPDAKIPKGYENLGSGCDNNTNKINVRKDKV